MIEYHSKIIFENYVSDIYFGSDIDWYDDVDSVMDFFEYSDILDNYYFKFLLPHEVNSLLLTHSPFDNISTEFIDLIEFESIMQKSEVLFD